MASTVLGLRARTQILLRLQLWRQLPPKMGPRQARLMLQVQQVHRLRHNRRKLLIGTSDLTLRPWLAHKVPLLLLVR